MKGRGSASQASSTALALHMVQKPHSPMISGGNRACQEGTCPASTYLKSSKAQPLQLLPPLPSFACGRCTTTSIMRSRHCMHAGVVTHDFKPLQLGWPWLHRQQGFVMLGPSQLMLQQEPPNCH